MPPEPLDYERTPEPIPPPVLRALRARRVVGVITLFALAICFVNLPDGRPYQFESTVIFVLGLVLYLATALWVRGARAEARARPRR